MTNVLLKQDILCVPVSHLWYSMHFKIGFLCRWCFLVAVVFGWWPARWWKIWGCSLWFYWRIRTTQVNVNSGTFLVAPLQLCCHPHRWFVPYIILPAWKNQMLSLRNWCGQKNLSRDMSHLLWFGPFTGSDTSLDDWLLERATSLSIISAWDRFLSPSMKKK